MAPRRAVWRRVEHTDLYGLEDGARARYGGAVGRRRRRACLRATSDTSLIETARVFERIPGFIRRNLMLRASRVLPRAVYGKNFLRNVALDR